ncbi:phospholipase A2 [Rhodotorula toruloides]|uniref:Phospholipase A2 n=1 Tax=Rhodotorula toruloides TaxID=5286 RepID=A0A511KDP4_RHOTO|nr:phospholipase A2 [Rhodotorula toruloides]
MSVDPVERILRELVRDYQALNPALVAELTAVPSALDFARFTSANRPLILRRAGQTEQIPALERWTDEYLVGRLAEGALSISVTPEGNADAIVDGVFAEPATVDMPLEALLAKLREDEQTRAGPVHYLQSQNGNLGEEYAILQEDVGTDGPAFAREVFGDPPEVANIWIGGSRSKTSLHKDPYENIYMVVRGSKTFTLLAPTEAYCLHEQLFPHATYSFSAETSSFCLNRTSPPTSLPWIPVDPLAPDLERFPRYAFARPTKVTLNPGDMLYLPALWYHFVEQDVGWGPEGEGKGVKAAIAVNWWYEMRHDGLLWSTCSLIRRLVLALDGRQEEDLLNSDDEE